MSRNFYKYIPSLEGITRLFWRMMPSSAAVSPPSPDLPARGTLPISAGLPTGRQTVTAQDGQMKFVKKKVLKRETVETRSVKTRSLSNNEKMQLRPKSAKKIEASVTKKAGKPPRKRKARVETEVEILHKRLHRSTQEKVEESEKDDENGRAMERLAVKYAMELHMDEGCLSDAHLLSGQDESLQVSVDVVKAKIEKMKKEVKDMRNNVGSGVCIGKFGEGSETARVFDCLPRRKKLVGMPAVSFIDKNIVFKSKDEEEKKNPKVRCNCTGGKCSIDCQCLKFSIQAGKAFAIGNMAFRAKGENFWTAGIVACGSDCVCQGSCSFGDKQLSHLPEVEIYRRDETLGFGLRAKKNIAPGQIVLEFRGEVQNSESRATVTTYAFQTSSTDDDCQKNLLIQAGVRYLQKTQIYIEPTKKGNVGRFVNMSEQPNLFPMRVWANDVSPKNVRMFFVCERPVRAGEELFIHYGEGYLKDHLSGLPCRCLSVFCENSNELEGWSLSQKIKYILTKNDFVNNLLKKDGHDLETVISRWTTNTKKTFYQALRALLNRAHFFDAKTRTAAISAFETLFFKEDEKVILKNKFLCSKKQLEIREQYKARKDVGVGYD